MPLWVQPLLRFRQGALESNGLIQTRNSVAMTIQLNGESAGTLTKPNPPGESINLRGTVYTPSATT